jgi:hypothetical protein
MDCGPDDHGFLTKWRLRINGDSSSGNMWFDYTCSQILNATATGCTDRNTPWAAFGSNGGEVPFMDRHTLDCGSDEQYLQKFHIAVSGSNMRYEYTCCGVNFDFSPAPLISNGNFKDGEAVTADSFRCLSPNCG